MIRTIRQHETTDSWWVGAGKHLANEVESLTAELAGRDAALQIMAREIVAQRGGYQNPGEAHIMAGKIAAEFLARGKAEAGSA